MVRQAVTSGESTKANTAASAANSVTAGIWYSIVAYTLWGLLPLYWKLLDVIPAVEVLAHRILWSCVFTSAALLFTRGWHHIRPVMTDGKQLRLVCTSGVLISVNWYTYIWAVNSHHVIEASMGYYINPLVVMGLGVLVLKERFNRGQVLAVLFAATGVAVMTAQYGRIPWVAFGLAGTFALYGLSKKITRTNALTALVLETVVVTPIALFFILSRELAGVGALARLPLPTVLVLVGSGVATATPLLLFAQGARRIPLSLVGFLQYIAPSLSLMLGVFVFKEHFSVGHFIGFSFIWIGLVIFTRTTAIAAAAARYSSTIKEPYGR